MKKQFLFLVTCLLLLVSCEDQPVKSDKITRDPKESVYVDVKYVHSEKGMDINSITRTYHDAKGNVILTKVSFDTIPTLPVVKDTLTKTFTDADGNEDEKDTIVFHPKDYQFFISVKK